MENKEYFTIINKNQLDHYRFVIRNLGIVDNDPFLRNSNWIVCYYECRNNIMRYRGWDCLEHADLVNKSIIYYEEYLIDLIDNKMSTANFCELDEDDAEYVKENPEDFIFKFVDDDKFTTNAINNLKSSKTKPSYYKGEYDLISHFYDIMTHEELRGFLKGNVIKYIDRYQDKNGIEDLNKAREYNGRLIEFEKKLKGEDNEFIQ